MRESRERAGRKAALNSPPLSPSMHKHGDVTCALRTEC